MDEADHWQQRLDALARQAGVVGAVLGVLRLRDSQAGVVRGATGVERLRDGRDGQADVLRVATGVLNARTGRATTVDSLFQIGSITKPMTATVVSQLVDEGRIGLDQPVKDLLPGWRLGSDELTDTVTVRHLLNHTSGLDGDVFIDTGRGDDCLARYVAALADVPQMHPVGEIWSYCNTGYSILGRIIEVVTGQTWDAAMRARLFAPLGLTHTVTLPEEALLFDTAVGHMTGLPDPRVTDTWMLPRSNGPAGVVTTSVGDLLAFARLHMDDGVAPDGRRVVSETMSRALRRFSVVTPETPRGGDTWGLSFKLFAWGAFGHDGNTLGQSAFLRVLPDAGLAVALLTNDDSPQQLAGALFKEVFRELAGVELPGPMPVPDDPPALDIAPWVGEYVRGDTRVRIAGTPEGPTMRVTQIGELAALAHEPEETFRLLPVDDGLCAIIRRGSPAPVWLMRLSNGVRYVHFGSRATRRVDVGELRA